jgi:hypothetical protein
MKHFSWRRFAIGLPLGAILSFLTGCCYAYAVWNPPSNDWGNEKETTSFLLVPVAFIVLVILALARRPLGRLIARAVTIGRAGLLGLVIGAAILPLVQGVEVASEHHAVRSKLPAEHQILLVQLAAIGAQLKQADAVVLEDAILSKQGQLGWFIFRLAAFTAKPVFVVYNTPGGGQPKTLRKYWIAQGAACPNPSSLGMTATADACLAGIEIPDFADFPSTGVLLYTDADINLVQFNMPPYSDGSLYPAVTLAALKKPAALPTTPYTQPYDPDAEPKIVWRNWCDVKNYGPFPFGRGAHWHECAELLKLTDVADRIFGPGPAFR